MLLVRPFFMGFCLWLAAWMSAAPAVAAGVSCEDWNTEGFFKRAGAADISRCLKAGADVNARDEYGWTPLHAAAIFSTSPAIVTVLVKAGADVNARAENGWTPLYVAAGQSTTPAMVTALLDAGADPAARDEWGKTPWDHIKADSPLKGTDVYRRLNEGRFK